MITCPDLESYTLPELSIIRVLDDAWELLPVTDELLPDATLLELPKADERVEALEALPNPDADDLPAVLAILVL